MKEWYGGDSLEFAGRQFMSGWAFAFISVSFLIGAVMSYFIRDLSLILATLLIT